MKQTVTDKFKGYYQQVRVRGFMSSLFHHTIQIFIPLISMVVKKSFVFNSLKFNYLLARYGATWANERALEVPIFSNLLLEGLSRNQRILEIGHVLGHYIKRDDRWTVLDKYEVAEGVLNEDIADYKEADKYDLILSISTMEHVGFDEDKKDPDKILRSINHVTRELLHNNGKFIFSVPFGYNPTVDQLLDNNAILSSEIYYFKRNGIINWTQVEFEQVRNSKYGDQYFGSASAIALIVIDKEKTL